MKLSGLWSCLFALVRSPGAARLKSDPPRDGLLRGEPEQMAHLHGSFVCFFFLQSLFHAAERQASLLTSRCLASGDITPRLAYRRNLLPAS